jgi:hypothetical protein
MAWPLVASLALHLGAGWVFFGSPQFLPRQGKNLTLTVTLAGNQQPEPRKIAQDVAPSAPPAVPNVPASPSAQSTDGQITEKARFLLAPDLSALEAIAVPVSGSLTVRLHVSSLGTVDRVVVIKSDPVPKELLDGLFEKLRQTRLAPALAGSQPVASTLDLVIRYETSLETLQRDP